MTAARTRTTGQCGTEEAEIESQSDRCDGPLADAVSVSQVQVLRGLNSRSTCICEFKQSIRSCGEAWTWVSKLHGVICCSVARSTSIPTVRRAEKGLTTPASRENNSVRPAVHRLRRELQPRSPQLCFYQQKRYGGFQSCRCPSPDSVQVLIRQSPVSGAGPSWLILGGATLDKSTKFSRTDFGSVSSVDSSNLDDRSFLRESYFDFFCMPYCSRTTSDLHPLNRKLASTLQFSALLVEHDTVLRSCACDEDILMPRRG